MRKKLVVILAGLGILAAFSSCDDTVDNVINQFKCEQPKCDKNAAGKDVAKICIQGIWGQDIVCDDNTPHCMLVDNVLTGEGKIATCSFISDNCQAGCKDEHTAANCVEGYGYDTACKGDKPFCVESEVGGKKVASCQPSNSNPTSGDSKGVGSACSCPDTNDECSIALLTEKAPDLDSDAIVGCEDLASVGTEENPRICVRSFEIKGDKILDIPSGYCSVGSLDIVCEDLKGGEGTCAFASGVISDIAFGKNNVEPTCPTGSVKVKGSKSKDVTDLKIKLNVTAQLCVQTCEQKSECGNDFDCLEVTKADNSKVKVCATQNMLDSLGTNIEIK